MRRFVSISDLATRRPASAGRRLGSSIVNAQSQFSGERHRSCVTPFLTTRFPYEYPQKHWELDETGQPTRNSLSTAHPCHSRPNFRLLESGHLSAYIRSYLQRAQQIGDAPAVKSRSCLFSRSTGTVLASDCPGNNESLLYRPKFPTEAIDDAFR
jgi:hypothetical protein